MKHTIKLSIDRAIQVDLSIGKTKAWLVINGKNDEITGIASLELPQLHALIFALTETAERIEHELAGIKRMSYSQVAAA